MTGRTKLGYEVQGSLPEHQDIVDRIVSISESVGFSLGNLSGDSSIGDAQFYQTTELAARVAVALLDHSGTIGQVPQNEEVRGEDSHIKIIANLIEDGTIEAYNLSAKKASVKARYDREFKNLLNVEPGSSYGYPDADSQTYSEELRAIKRRSMVDPDGTMTEEEYEDTFLGNCDEDEYSEKYYDLDGNLYYDGKIQDQAYRKVQLAKLAGWIKLRSENVSPDTIVVPSPDDDDAILQLRTLSSELWLRKNEELKAIAIASNKEEMK